VADISHTSNWTTSTFDPLGRGLTITLPDGSVMQTSYEGNYATVTDQAGKQRRQKVDSLGRVIRIDEPNSSGGLGTLDAPAQATTYDYDAQGNIVHIAQGSSPVQHRYFKYDALGRLTHERQVEQSATFTAADPVTGNSSWTRKLVYDETIDSVTYSGLLTTTFDARNVQTTFRYDNLNRAYQVNYSDGTPTVTNKYDQNRSGYFNKGHLTEALTGAAGSIPATSQLYDFDSVGRVVHQQQTVGSQSYDMSYAYNLGSALTSQTYPSGRIVNYAFDDGARLSQVSSGATIYASQYDYTSSTGLLKSVTLGNNAAESYVYNARLQLQSLDLTRAGTQIQHFDYKYGVYDPATNTLDETKNNGQIAQVEGFINAQKQWQQRYAYDKLGRLASTREFRGDNSQQSYLVNYEYDVFGNRYQKQAQNGGNPFTQIWVETAHVDQATNRFNTGVTYDNAGNVTVDSKFRNRKFEYDANNRQKQSRNLDDSGAVNSIFDATGQRVATQVSGSLINVLVYDAMGQLVAEYNSTPVQGGTQYIFSDHQNTPRTITNAQGSVIARHDYLPFGEDVLNSVGMRASVQGYGGNEAARQKYAGMERNEATAMAHTLWRQYDSLSGRWTAPDPYRGSMSIQNPQSLNRYSYVDNDPVNLVDPAGLMPKLPDASTSWSDVADGFWGQGNLMNRPRNIGQLIIALASARRDRLIKARIDGKLVAEYLRKRKFEAAKRILNSNPNVGLYQDGAPVWGELAATYVEGVEGATAEAMVATANPMQGMDLALRILLKAGWRAVVNRLKKLRGPDFKILNVNILAGITRFIPRGEDMSTALHGVSASNMEGQLTFVVGWLIQLRTPTKEEITDWGKGLSVNVDFFVGGGGGVMRSFSSDVRGVYVGVGVGGGWGASFQYEVW
jgi:RHS repeat-associated protein